MPIHLLEPSGLTKYSWKTLRLATDIDPTSANAAKANFGLAKAELGLIMQFSNLSKWDAQEHLQGSNKVAELWTSN